MDDAPVSVAVVGSRAEAELIVGLLSSYGLSAFASTDDAGGQEPQLQLQGVRVLVAASDEAAARRLLAAVDESDGQSRQRPTWTAGAHGRDRPKIGRMCRNITELRGLEPPATDDEVEAAARQFIRKVSGLQKPPAGAEAAYERAIAHVTAEVHGLLDILPARRQPPATVPPLRRPEVRARIAAREAAAVGTSRASSKSAPPGT